MEENKCNAADYSGHKNLETLSNSHNFNNWMYQEIRFGLKGDILEVGSGIGTFSQKIIQDFPNSRIILTDVSSSYVKELELRFSNKSTSVFKLDLNRREDYEKIGYEQFDSILAVNVLEHVQDDEFALEQLYKMLRKNGSLIILVPCHKFLFNVIDRNVGHYRRYTKKELESKIRKTNFIINRIFYFNILGVIGWYVNGNLAKNSQVSGIASKIFDYMVPISRCLERVSGKKMGLSIICHLVKCN